MSKRLKIASLSLVFVVGIFFYRQTNATDDNKITKPIRGAIIPHHLLARELMVDLGYKLAPEKPQNIVIVGPNHFETGDNHLITDDYQFATTLAIPLLAINPEIVNKDHACYAPKSVLKEHLGATNITCLLISSRTTEEEIAVFIKKINKEYKDMVLVASVDFSHYLTLEEANKNDLYTQKLIEAKDLNSILKLGNNYLDSPKTIAVLFDYLKMLDVSDSIIINHLNSAQILRQPDLPSTTSYFEIIYR